MLKRLLLIILIASFYSYGATSSDIKIRDLVSVEGFRTNYLTGYGIVVGLNGTGDGTTSRYTLISIANMLRKMGIYIDPAQVRTKNAAAVMVTANLPPFAKPGMTVDVQVASIGDAKDIRNGLLIRTPLYGPDGKIYAFAQGPVSTGGGYLESNKTGKIQKGFTTAGIIPNGAIIEEELPFDFNSLTEITLNLKNPDFKKASLIAKTINKKYPNVAQLLDATSIKVKLPEETSKADFLASILDLKVSLDSDKPTIVIYEKTGTVIMSGDIVIDAPVYVSHGNIYVSVETKPIVSQPPPLSAGQTVVTQQTTATVTEEKGRIIEIEKPTLKDLVKALNDLGVSPYDLIAIIQAIKNAGKINAEIIVM